MPRAVAEGHGIRVDRIARVVFRSMKGARERAVLDEKVVHEKLPADINGDHGGRGFQVRRSWARTARRDVFPGHVSGRPLLGETDSVGELLPVLGESRCAERGAQHPSHYANSLVHARKSFCH